MSDGCVCIFSSYGSVFKAIHKESGQVVAIKQVPVESDLQEIIKEISIMQQCDRYAYYPTIPHHSVQVERNGPLYSMLNEYR